MQKKLSNLGKVLSKVEQKDISGGHYPPDCYRDDKDCRDGIICYGMRQSLPY